MELGPGFAQASDASTPGDPVAPLQPANRRGLRRLGASVRPVQRHASSRGAGRGGRRRFLTALADRGG